MTRHKIKNRRVDWTHRLRRHLEEVRQKYEWADWAKRHAMHVTPQQYNAEIDAFIDEMLKLPNEEQDQ